MAIQINLTAEQSPVGEAFPTAYARVTNVVYNVKGGTLTISVAIYSSNAARVANKTPIGSKLYGATSGVGGMPDVDAAASPGLRKACYTYLKTLPEYTAGTDV